MPKTLTRAQRTKAASANRRAAKKRETRQAILDAATQVFLAQGKDDFSLRQVAEETGYSPTTIYLYFRDKDDLLFHAAQDGFVRFGAALLAAYDAHDDPWDKLMAEGEAYLRFGLDNPVHYRLMFMSRGEYLDREIPAEDCVSVLSSFDVLNRTVRECIEADILPAADLATSTGSSTAGLDRLQARTSQQTQTYSALVWMAVHGIVSLTLATPYFDKSQAYALFNLQKETMLAALKQA